MEYAKAANATGEDTSRTWLDGGLRSRARLSGDRTPDDTPKCPQGVLRAKLAREYPARHRGYYRPAFPGTREGRTASAERCPAWRNPASHRQQSSDYREYHHVEAEDGDVGRDTQTFKRRP